MTKKIIVGVIFVAALFAGFELFVSGPRSDVNRLKDNVQKLESGVQVAPEDVVLQLPPRNTIISAVRSSAERAGVTVNEINFLDGRAEIVSESDPTSVARFARDISSSKNLQAVAIDGSLLPQSVVTLEPKG